jgi:hypothetical protein
VRNTGGFAQRLSRKWLDANAVQRGMVSWIDRPTSAAPPAAGYWQGIFRRHQTRNLIRADCPRFSYWNVRLNDELWNAVEFVYRQSSLNGHRPRSTATDASDRDQPGGSAFNCRQWARCGA